MQGNQSEGREAYIVHAVNIVSHGLYFAACCSISYASNAFDLLEVRLLIFTRKLVTLAKRTVWSRVQNLPQNITYSVAGLF
jgi:hypothetical protein